MKKVLPTLLSTSLLLGAASPVLAQLRLDRAQVDQVRPAAAGNSDRPGDKRVEPLRMDLIEDQDTPIASDRARLESAVQRMRAAGISPSDLREEDVRQEMINNRRVYRAQHVNQRRLFGLFDRQVPTDTIVDEETGEVTQRPVTDRGFFARILDRLSF